MSLLLGSGGVGVYLYVRHALLASFDQAHELAVQSALENVRIAGDGVELDVPGFQEEFEELNLTLGVVACELWDANGRELARASMHHAQLGVHGPAREVLGDREHAMVVRRVSVGGQAVLVVARRAGDVTEELGSLRAALWWVLPLVVVGAWSLAYFMAGRALLPARRAFARQRAFMSDASHELRTPLAVIRAQAEVQLAADRALGKDVTRTLGVIARTSEQMGELVDGMLFLARADDEGAASVRPTTRLDLVELVDELVAAFAPFAQTVGASLRWQEPLAGVPVQGEASQLQRLLGVLIDNALRHGGAGEVEISVSTTARHAQVRIRDHGPGIPAELLADVFARFVRGDRARTAHRGHGLGLAIARSIALEHGGTVQLSSPPQGGTSALLELPRLPE